MKNGISENDAIDSRTGITEQAMEDPRYYHHLLFPLTLTGLLGATVTVLVTTLDDSIWLMPFVAAGGLRRERNNNNNKTPNSGLSLRSRFVHAGTFLATLVTLSFLCCMVALGLVRFWGSSSHEFDCDNNGTGFGLSTEKLEIQLEWISVVVCWVLAAGFCVKMQLKKRRRRRQQNQQRNVLPQGGCNNPTEVQPNETSDNGFRGTTGLVGSAGVPVAVPSHRSGYGSIVVEPQTEPIAPSEVPGSEETETDCMPVTVASLTAMGFLDEISYFPSLVIGKVFTVAELMLGTLLAGLIVLAIQVFVFRRCKPLIDFLDERVPLCAIIACFAVVLTLRLVFDVVRYNNTAILEA
mmetsp:Transcript_29500/g.63248  ORF Transcript_29500/g.63248 Transcript_29500/m.63248 type:complete len:352 (-) Transcript_29500:835-1890(-)